MAGKRCQSRILLVLGLCLATGTLSRTVVTQDPAADDLSAELPNSALLQGPPDMTTSDVSNDIVDPPSNQISPSKSPVERLSADVDAISERSGTDATTTEFDVSDLEEEGREAAATALAPSPAKAKAARIAAREISSRHIFMADAGAFNLAKEEISRAKAEEAAAAVEKAVADKQHAQKQAAYLLAVAEGYRKQEGQALKEAGYAATQAARRAAAQFDADHMRKARLLEARSWKASQLASRTRKAADAAIQRATTDLAKVQAS